MSKEERKEGVWTPIHLETKKERLAREKRDREQARLASAYETIIRELDAISDINETLEIYRNSQPQTPQPVPPSTSSPFSEWKKKRDQQTKLNVSTTGVTMRVVESNNVPDVARRSINKRVPRA